MTLTAMNDGAPIALPSISGTIKAATFEREGHYTLTLYSEDDADNSSDNRVKGKEIMFSIDKTPPTAVITGVENRTTYNIDAQQVTLTVSDNLQLEKVIVTLNDELFAQWDQEEIVLARGTFDFEIESLNERQTLQVTYYDAAGNEGNTEIIDFLITTNLFVQFYQNSLLFYGTIASIATISVGTASFLVFRKPRLPHIT